MLKARKLVGVVMRYRVQTLSLVFVPTGFFSLFLQTLRPIDWVRKKYPSCFLLLLMLSSCMMQILMLWSYVLLLSLIFFQITIKCLLFLHTFHPISWIRTRIGSKLYHFCIVASFKYSGLPKINDVVPGSSLLSGIFFKIALHVWFSCIPFALFL